MTLVFASINLVLKVFGSVPEKKITYQKISFVYSYDTKIGDTAGKARLHVTVCVTVTIGSGSSQ
jgi:hypothetical protein